MRIIEKISLTVFSIIVLILSILMILMICGWFNVELLAIGVAYVMNHNIFSNIVLVLSIIFILFALKCIFFESNENKKNGMKDSILLENESGKLLISRDTVENLTCSIVKGFDSAENAVSKVMIDKENNVKIDILLFVHPDAIIKDLSTNLQSKVKETVKKSLDIDVKEVNIKVRNIAEKKPVISE